MVYSGLYQPQYETIKFCAQYCGGGGGVADFFCDIHFVF